jgi:hypothetical protein
MLLPMPLAKQAFGNAEICVLIVAATSPKFMFYFLNVLIFRGFFYNHFFFLNRNSKLSPMKSITPQTKK